jgi:hypothetical protein
VRHTMAHLRVVSTAVAVGFGFIGASPGYAQTRVTLDDLRRVLAAGDIITVVPADGEPVAGRLVRLGDIDLDVRPVDTRKSQRPEPRDVTFALDAIRSLERPRDPVRNGTLLGAGIGAGFGAAMFVHATIIDRNELAEWAGFYVGAAAISTGIGALVGWAIDAASSKPYIRFDPSAEPRTRISVQPAYAPGRGIAVTVSFAR